MWLRRGRRRLIRQHSGRGNVHSGRHDGARWHRRHMLPRGHPGHRHGRGCGHEWRARWHGRHGRRTRGSGRKRTAESSSPSWSRWPAWRVRKKTRTTRMTAHVRWWEAEVRHFNFLFSQSFCLAQAITHERSFQVFFWVFFSTPTSSVIDLDSK